MPDFRAALGRGGDRMMGHLTPGEVVIPQGTMTPKLWSAFQEALDSQGMMPEQYVVGSGQNSINPMTGQPEFLAQASAPGRSVRDFQGGSVQGPEGSGRGGIIAPITNTAPPGIGRTPAPIDPRISYPRAETQSGGIVDDVLDTITPSASGLGFLDLMAPGLGALTRLGERYGGEIRPETKARLDRLAATRRDPDYMQGLSKEREQRELSFTRPVQEPTPQFLGLTSAMSPLQMRSAIASRAVAGQAGEYSSPEAATFYDNLLQRALIGDTGDLFGLDTLLPIDLQYLAQIRGIENPADTRSLLTALQG